MTDIIAEIGDVPNKGERIILHDTLWNDKPLCQSIPGKYWSVKLAKWSYPVSWPACVVLRSTFGDRLKIGPELTAWATKRRDELDRSLSLHDVLSFDGDLSYYFTEGNDHDERLYPHQVPGRDFLVTAREALLGCEMGSGKSAQTLAAIRIADTMGEGYPALIVCPNTLKRNWEREIRQWLPEANPFVIHGSADKRRKQIAEAAESPNAIIIMNIESMRLHSKLAQFGSTRLKRCIECDKEAGDPDLKAASCEKHEKELNTIPFQVTVADECVPYDTEIITSTGAKRVHEVKKGDLVLGIDHRTGDRVWSEVKGVRRSSLRETVKVENLEVTAEHPVWVSDEGTLCYANQHAESYRDNENMRVVRDSVPSGETFPAILREVVRRKRKDVEHRSAETCREHYAHDDRSSGSAGETAQASEQRIESVSGSGSSDEGTRSASCTGVPELDRGERNGSYRPAADVARRFGLHMGSGVRSARLGSDSELPHGVQAGYRVSGTQDRDRSERKGSWKAGGSGNAKGSEEAGVSYATWVGDSVGVERGDPERSLWNLETATGNYFANSVLVHNCHRVKEPNALQSRAIKSVFHGPTVRYRWALTGTPIANHPGDLWSILNTISPENWPAKSAFIDRYAMTEFNAFGGMTIRGLKPEHREEFHALLAPHFRRMLKSQVLKSLPDKVFIRHDVEMSPKQAKAYKDIEKDLLTILDDGTVLVANGSLPGALRMLQFASAYCEVDQGETPEDPTTWKVTLTDTPKSSKIDEMMSIIEDTVTEDERGRLKRKPVVVAAEHRQLIDLASARLTEAGIPFGRVTGAESPDEREANVRAFQAGKLDVMLFTFAAGGVGINLTRADTMIRLQRSWSMIANNQGVDRIHRIGSEIHESVTIIDLVTAGTIEETQIERLYEKAERMEEIVRDREQLMNRHENPDDLDAEIARIETTTLMEG